MRQSASLGRARLLGPQVLLSVALVGISGSFPHDDAGGAAEVSRNQASVARPLWVWDARQGSWSGPQGAVEAWHEPNEAPEHQHFGGLDREADTSRPPQPGSFPGIDPEGLLARDGVMQPAPHSCPVHGISVGADGRLYFVANVPGTKGATVLVRACRGKNGTWTFEKVPTPRRSPGVVSCGAVDGGTLLGMDVVLCSDNEGNMLQWLPPARDGDEQEPHSSDSSLTTGHLTGLWLAITPPPTERLSWLDIRGLTLSAAEMRAAWRQAASTWGVGGGKWHMSKDSSVRRFFDKKVEQAKPSRHSQQHACLPSHPPSRPPPARDSRA